MPGDARFMHATQEVQEQRPFPQPLAQQVLAEPRLGIGGEHLAVGGVGLQFVEEPVVLFDRGLVVTTSTFTPQAREVALDQPIALIDGVELVRMFAEHKVVLKHGPHGELRHA